MRRHLGQIGLWLWAVALNIVFPFIGILHALGREWACRSRAGSAIAAEIGNAEVEPSGNQG